MPPITFYLNFGMTPKSRTRHPLEAWNVYEAKKKAREYLRTIVLPTDRPGLSLSWAYLENPDGKIWLVQEPKEDED